MPLCTLHSQPNDNQAFGKLKIIISVNLPESHRQTGLWNWWIKNKYMKTSNIIISVLSIMLLVGIIIKTNNYAKNEYDLNTIPSEKLNDVAVGTFNKIEISGCVVAEISSSKTQKVQYFVKGDYKDNIPEIKTIDSTLYILGAKKQNCNKAFVSIKTPSICSIIAHNIDKLKIDSIKLDTLSIALTNSTIKTNKLKCRALILELTDSSYFKGYYLTIDTLVITAKNHSMVILHDHSGKKFDGKFYDYSQLSIDGYIKNSNIFTDSTSLCNKTYRIK